MRAGKGRAGFRQGDEGRSWSRGGSRIQERTTQLSVNRFCQPLYGVGVVHNAFGGSAGESPLEELGEANWLRGKGKNGEKDEGEEGQKETFSLVFEKEEEDGEGEEKD